MSRSIIFAANWKMHLAPAEARAFAERFRALTAPQAGRELWFFPSAVSLEATAVAFSGRPDIRVGAQDLYWEPKGPYTGATSIALAQGAGATGALVGHSERRHVFGETDEDTRKKVGALLSARCRPFLCIGETLTQRERGETESVVLRQLTAALDGIGNSLLGDLVIAYEPVWAIGTGRNATPEDAAKVHCVIRTALASRGANGAPILYGGSVNRGNVDALLERPEIDGVLVGGASLDPTVWSDIVNCSEQ